MTPEIPRAFQQAFENDPPFESPAVSQSTVEAPPQIRRHPPANWWLKDPIIAPIQPEAKVIRPSRRLERPLAVLSVLAIGITFFQLLREHATKKARRKIFF